MNRNLLEKLKESISSVLPVSVIVLILHFTLTPLSGGTFGLFIIGTVLLIMGMGLFTLGADMAMMPMGERIGAQLTKSKNLMLFIVAYFIMGAMITIAEPDLQVLANQVPAVPDLTLILTVALGVGIFLVISLLRTVFNIRLSYLFILFYTILFVGAAFTSPDFLPVAFDSGGVTTGPITVPFILALGIGVSSVRGGKASNDDSFGLVGLASIGPIMAVLILGMFFDASSTGYGSEAIAEINTVRDIILTYGHNFIHYAEEVAIALSPIIVFFIVFQVKSLKLPKSQIIKVIVGVIYTYIGLVIFLTGVNTGFLPAGKLIGEMLASLDYKWILIPIGMIMGFFVVAAEPAVHVLNKEVEEISGGAISRRAMLISLSLGVAISIGLAMIRVLTGITIWYFLLPGYLIAIGLTFFVPRIFTAVAFDSGGVASGPMTATFLLPFAMGASTALGGNVMTDAFGIVAMVAMTPLITIQMLGLIYKFKTRDEDTDESISDDEVIDF